MTYAASARDEVDGAVAVVCTPASGAVFPVGPTSVKCSARDAAGNAASGSFLITTTDRTPPRLSPPDVTANATDSLGTIVKFAVSGADVVDGTVSASCAPESGARFVIGATSVTCNAVDRSGNLATAAFTVTVKGATAQLLDLSTRITVLQPPLGNRTALLAQLEAARKAAQAGDRATAIARIDDFVGTVRALTGKKLTSDAAAQLVAEALRIRAVAGG